MQVTDPSPQTEKAQLQNIVAQGSGNVTTTAEVVFEYTDFFDTSSDVAAPYFQQTFNTTSSLIAPAIIARTPRRILSAKIYALPRFSLSSDQSSVLFLTTTPVSNGVELTGSVPFNAGNVQNTLIVPRSDAAWVKVGEWKASKLFDMTTILPSVNPTGDMAIFGGVVLNPDSMDPSGVPVQCKIVVRFSEQLPGASTLKILQTNLITVGALYQVEQTPATNKVVLLSTKGVSNNV